MDLSQLKDTWILRAFGILKVPMIFYLKPAIVEVSDKRVVTKIKLTRRSRNHLKSMYFGALCVGADCTGGYLAMRLIQKSGLPIALIFKDFHADFLKRPEGDVFFTSDDGVAIADLVKRASVSKERENLTVTVIATTPDKTGNEPVAKFVMTLSLKLKETKTV